MFALSNFPHISIILLDSQHSIISTDIYIYIYIYMYVLFTYLDIYSLILLSAYFL